MITIFKIFEKKSIKKSLVDQFDNDYIEKWYEENYDIDLSEVISMSSHDQIMDHFDEEEYKEDFIRDYISDYEFSEFDKDDLLRYLKKNIDDEKEIKILEIYNRNNYDEDDEDSVKETEYDDYMIDGLDKDELHEVIEDAREEDKCTKWIIKGWYSGQSGVEIFDEFNGFRKKGNTYYEYNRYGSEERIESKKLYNMLSNYIDDEKLKTEWKDNEDFEYKKETLENDIYNNTVLQRHLLSKDVDNVIPLAKLFVKEKSNKNIGSTYTFQKNYINKYIEDREDEDLIATALYFLHRNFGLNNNIEREYDKYLWLVNTDKYNL